MAAKVDWKFTGSNFDCALRCGFFCQSFSQSASDGTVTSACFAYARCTALELCPNAFRRENGIYYSLDTLTKKRNSLNTADRDEAISD